MAETYHNGTGLLISLPLWNGLARRTGAERLLEGGTARRAYHNGTESRISLPLWNSSARRTSAERLLDGGIARRAYHNGSAASLMPSSETPSREMWHLSRRV